MAGPTQYHIFLEEYAEHVKSKDDETFHVLVILTDGEMVDDRETIEPLVAASSLPLGIVIVGIGDSDFSQMEELATGETLEDKCERSIVHFVRYKDFEH